MKVLNIIKFFIIVFAAIIAVIISRIIGCFLGLFKVPVALYVSVTTFPMRLLLSLSNKLCGCTSSWSKLMAVLNQAIEKEGQIDEETLKQQITNAFN